MAFSLAKEQQMSLPKIIDASKASLINKALRPFSYGESLGTILKAAAESAESAVSRLVALELEATGAKTHFFEVVVPVVAGSTLARFLKPGLTGTVTEVKRFIDNRPTSAADGVTSKLDNGAAVLVAEFDLTASPGEANTETATTLGVGTSLTASSVIKATVAAGADVVVSEGAAITYIIKVVEP